VPRGFTLVRARAHARTKKSRERDGGKKNPTVVHGFTRATTSVVCSTPRRRDVYAGFAT